MRAPRHDGGARHDRSADRALADGASAPRSPASLLSPAFVRLDGTGADGFVPAASATTLRLRSGDLRDIGPALRRDSAWRHGRRQLVEAQLFRRRCAFEMLSEDLRQGSGGGGARQGRVRGAVAGAATTAPVTHGVEGNRWHDTRTRPDSERRQSGFAHDEIVLEDRPPLSASAEQRRSPISPPLTPGRAAPPAAARFGAYRLKHPSRRRR